MEVRQYGNEKAKEETDRKTRQELKGVIKERRGRRRKARVEGSSK